MARIKTLFKSLRARIASLFQPEEVEVTFTVKGKTISYSYTVAEEKQVA